MSKLGLSFAAIALGLLFASIHVRAESVSERIDSSVLGQGPSPAPKQISQEAPQAPVPPAPVPPTAPTEQAPSVPQAPAEQVPGLPQAPTELPPAPGATAPEKAATPSGQILVERGGVLLPSGVLQIEPELELDHFTSNDVAINGITLFEAIIIGTLRVDRLDRDIWIGALTARYGLPYRTQIEVRVPYLYRSDDQVLGVNTPNVAEETITNNGIGDVTAAASYQPLVGGGFVPDVVLRLEGRFPTGQDPFEVGTQTVNGVTIFKEPPLGTGFYGIEPGFTLVWTADPVVAFTGFNYTVNLDRDVGGAFGHISPGNTVEWFTGLNVAINERVAINMSFDDNRTGHSHQNGKQVDGSNFDDARLGVGASFGITPDITLLVQAQAGLTRQSPDYVFTVRLPISLRLFD